MDRPLAAYKLGVNAAVIAPYTNWRGEFSGGTYLRGSPSTAPVSWPGYSTTAWYQGKPPQEQNRVYMGTVLEGQRDASGQMYMRNRMYDPATDQFTQTDPIGIAGGLNTYGFAAGDPVTYPTSGVNHVEWYFFPNANGENNVSSSVLDLLHANNIVPSFWASKP